MNTLWIVMILLVCPLMMIFMMRGMHGGGHDSTTDRQHDRGAPPAQPGSRDERLAELEREVAELRGARARQSEHPEVSRR